MAKYIVLEKSYIGNTIVEAGVEVEFDGTPGPNLQPKKGRKADVPQEEVPAAEGDASLT